MSVQASLNWCAKEARSLIHKSRSKTGKLKVLRFVVMRLLVSVNFYDCILLLMMMTMMMMMMMK